MNMTIDEFLDETWAAIVAEELWDRNPWWKTYWLPKLEQVAPPEKGNP